MQAPPEKVSFGYCAVEPEEKKRLVHDQFTPIARTYDRADALLSFGLHFLWKRAVIRLLRLEPGEAVLDICGGTADLALLAARRIGPSGQAVVCDFNRPMMEVGREKLDRAGVGGRAAFVKGDAEALPHPDSAFDAATVGFGLRNLVDLDRGLREIHRVLRPGGRLAALEFSLPRRGWLRSLYDLYSFRLMPRAARIITGTDGPFRYLAESIRVFDPPAALAQRLAEVGFADIEVHPRTFGIAAVYFGRKPLEVSHAEDRT
jgi:demethylmenaquinone methyltransferase/2-methoxy-6-polyprenyl-1,4-benzoquinol methylase